jgi:hypothetical protein
MSNNKTTSGRGLAQDGLTIGHLQNGLTIGHLGQALGSSASAHGQGAASSTSLAPKSGNSNGSETATAKK